MVFYSFVDEVVDCFHTYIKTALNVRQMKRFVVVKMLCLMSSLNGLCFFKGHFKNVDNLNFYLDRKLRRFSLFIFTFNAT